MTVVPLPPAATPDMAMPDTPAATAGGNAAGPVPFADAVARAFGDASASLARADASERAFATGTGGLQEMVLERARADIALEVATTAVSRTTQALTTILGMQI